jgi:hypothetical protein
MVTAAAGHFNKALGARLNPWDVIPSAMGKHIGVSNPHEQTKGGLTTGVEYFRRRFFLMRRCTASRTR